MFVLGRWEAKAAHPWLRGTTVGPWPGDGISNTTISQPASFAVVQTCELPGGIELSNLGDVCSKDLTGVLSLCQIHPVKGLQVVDFPFGENTVVMLREHSGQRLFLVSPHL